MANNTADRKLINEHIVEIRFQPNPKILDYRGTWAEMVSKHMKLSEWRIIENRFDVYDVEKTRRAFVSFRNAGFIVHNGKTKNYFPDQALKFMKLLFQQEGFGDRIFVIRLGVKSRFATGFRGSFDELLQLYSSRFVSVKQAAKEAFDALIIDIGCPLDFETAIGKINSMSGPMTADEISRFFKFEANPPDVGLYLELDYWKRPQKKMTAKEILSLVKEYSNENWDRHEAIKDLVIGSTE